MTTTQSTAATWAEEGVNTGVECADAPGHYVWNWPIQVEVGDDIEYCQSRAVWEGGVEFEIKRELLVGSQVRVRRQLHGVGLWVDVHIVSVNQDGPGAFIVEGTLHA